MRAFAAFECIDWSGAAVARPRGIAVARCCAGDAPPRLVRPEGGWSREAIVARLEAAAGARADLLVGIDFSPALPFVDRGAYLPGWPDEPADGHALWAMVDALCAGDPHLGCAGIVDHVEASRHYRRHGAREGDLFGGGAGRLRVVERVCRAAGLGPAQSVFNLVGAAQVGRSSLTGMRVLHRLAGAIPVWPFDPVPDRGPMIVEIYTTIAARAAGIVRGSKLRSGEALDAALASSAIRSRASGLTGPIDDHSSDAMLTAAWLRRASGDPVLWHGPPPAIAATEGWTFGVPWTMETPAPA